MNKWKPFAFWIKTVNINELFYFKKKMELFILFVCVQGEWHCYCQLSWQPLIFFRTIEEQKPHFLKFVGHHESKKWGSFYFFKFVGQHKWKKRKTFYFSKKINLFTFLCVSRGIGTITVGLAFSIKLIWVWPHFGNGFIKIHCKTCKMHTKIVEDVKPREKCKGVGLLFRLAYPEFQTKNPPPKLLKIIF